MSKKAEIIELRERLWDLIKENDRLTLTYEPYIPEDSEDYGLDFYGLKEDNDVLTEKVANFMRIIKDQDEQIWDLEAKLNESKKSKKPKSPKYAGGISFDLWPLSDWFRFSIDTWNPGRYFQLCIGPIRVELFAV